MSEHDFRYWGDDPYLICSKCDEVRDALTGRIVRIGEGEGTCD